MTDNEVADVQSVTFFIPCPKVLHIRLDFRRGFFICHQFFD